MYPPLDDRSGGRQPLGTVNYGRGGEGHHWLSDCFIHPGSPPVLRLTIWRPKTKPKIIWCRIGSVFSQQFHHFLNWFCLTYFPPTDFFVVFTNCTKLSVFYFFRGIFFLPAFCRCLQILFFHLGRNQLSWKSTLSQHLYYILLHNIFFCKRACFFS